jgi:predicted transcriptional regulator
MATMKGKRILTSIYLDPPVAAALRKLSEHTRVPQSVYLREALDDLLRKYQPVMVQRELQVATAPIDFKQLEREGLLVRQGDRFLVPRGPGSLPEHVRKQGDEWETGKSGTYVRFARKSKAAPRKAK